MAAWVQTFSGKRFDILDPTQESICIEDIAHALSQICRFTGHVKEFYSVGQHSILVSENVEPQHALWGLLHDASEAYIADVSHPLKHTNEMAAYRDIEAMIMGRICLKFGLEPKMPGNVEYYDQVLLFTEKRDLMGPAPEAWRDGPAPLDRGIVPMRSWAVEAAFLARFKELTK